MDTPSARTHELKSMGPVIAGYVAMLGVTAAALLGIRHWGARFHAPMVSHEIGAHVVGSGVHIEVFLHVLLVLLAIMILSQTFTSVFSLIAQPPVMGEMVAGIALGPSLLGAISPRVYEYLLPASIMPALNVVSGLGVLVFMFLVGVELDTHALRSRGHSVVAISHASIVAPLLLGCAAALWLYPRFANASVPFEVFALFMGVSMSITAFPVLARILAHYDMQSTELGSLAMGCAAVDDATAWCLLAVVVSLAKRSPQGALVTIALSAVFVLVAFVFVMPRVARLVRGLDLRGEVERSAVPVVLVCLVLSSVTTELIGIHAIFGAFVAGVAIPCDSRLARELSQKLRALVTTMLLPAFFACTGMRTQLGLLSGLENWLVCAGLIALACAGKFGGSAVAARLLGVGWRNAISLGALMNTRGLMELIVLNVGLDLGIVSPKLFTMLVLMALVTTFATSPIIAFTRASARAQNAPSCGAAS